MNPTTEQLSCVDNFQTGMTMRIGAYAGTGKTSTLQLITRSTNKFGVYLAFNKDIVTAAEGKFGPFVEARTQHSFAYRALVSKYGHEKLSGNVNGGLIASVLRLKAFWYTTEDLLSARGVGALIHKTIVNFCQSDDDELHAGHVALSGKFATISTIDKQKLREHILPFAIDVWEMMQNPKHRFPLGFDGYLKVWALSRPMFQTDYIMLDEAQDTNEVILGVMRRQQAQLIAVGDRHQAIYEWRGAVNAMEILPSELESRLSTSFRFGENVAGFANLILSKMGETLPLKGSAERADRLGIVSAPDAIIARTNARLMQEVFTCLENGQRPFLAGGTAEVHRWVKAADLLMAGQEVMDPPSLMGFKDWREVQKAAEEDEDLRRWVKLIDEHGTLRLTRVLERIPNRADRADIILSTGHKAKGLEWDSVRLCDDFLLGVDVTKEGPFYAENYGPELRLFYVAATRAKKELEVPTTLLAKFARIERGQ